MGRLGQIALILLPAALAGVSQACTTTSGAAANSAVSASAKLDPHPQAASVVAPEHLPELPPDAAGQGRVLTDYFKSHRLPLVGASVVDDRSNHQVILYGFVITPLDKTCAEEVARRIFHDANLTVVNRIVVEPALVTANTSAQGDHSWSANDSDADVLGGLGTAQSYIAPYDSSAYVESVQQRPPRGWLEGWYLLMPPVNWITTRRDPFAPLNRWEDLATFNTAENCEKIRVNTIEKVCEERLNACENLEYTLVCVPTDDPRLRRYLPGY